MRTDMPYPLSPAVWVRRSTALQIVLVALACMASDRFATSFALTSHGTVVLWLPNAVVLSAMLLTRSHQWWKFALTQLLSELLMNRGSSPLMPALGLALANLLEVLLAACLIRRLGGRSFAFANVREVLLFAAIAMGLAPGLAALLGTWFHYEAGREHVTFVSHWQAWWIGDGMGMVVLTPLLFGWLHVPRQQALRPPASRWEGLGLLALLAVLLYGLFYALPDRHSPWAASPLLLLPVFLWAALRFGIRGVSLLGCLVSLLAIVLTFQGRGMLSLLEPDVRALVLQQYLAALLLTGLAVAAVVNDLGLKYRSQLQVEHKLEAAHASLGELNRELEARVAQRTAELERLATTDPLTDAHNRRFLLARADIEVALAKRQSHAVSMVMFDVDHFKRINDSHGHNVGDRVLVALSQAVRQGLRPGDTFARVGGEEFVLLLPHSDAVQALQVAQRLRAAIESLDIRVGHALVLHITASFGVATLQADTSTVDALYESADKALYRAKDAGRNCVVVATAQAAPVAAAVARVG